MNIQVNSGIIVEERSAAVSVSSCQLMCIVKWQR